MNTARNHLGDAVDALAQEIQQNFVKSVLSTMGGDDVKSGGKPGKGAPTGGWLQAIAKAMGETLGNKAAEMVQLSDKMSQLNSAKKDNAQAMEGLDKKSKEYENKVNDNAANAQQFNETMTQFQATSQEYSMLNSVFSTAIKGLGEALSSMARKQ